MGRGMFKAMRERLTVVGRIQGHHFRFWGGGNSKSMREGGEEQTMGGSLLLPGGTKLWPPRGNQSMKLLGNSTPSLWGPSPFRGAKKRQHRRAAPRSPGQGKGSRCQGESLPVGSCAMGSIRTGRAGPAQN